MRGKFVFGAAINDDLGDVGGAANHAHAAAAEGHALTIAQMPAHDHGSGIRDDNGDNLFVYGSKAASPGGMIDSLGSNTTTQAITETIGGGQAHSHDITVEPASNMPPFLSMFFIMKA
jgi:microcystin-dependent protein